MSSRIIIIKDPMQTNLVLFSFSESDRFLDRSLDLDLDLVCDLVLDLLLSLDLSRSLDLSLDLCDLFLLRLLQFKIIIHTKIWESSGLKVHHHAQPLSFKVPTFSTRQNSKIFPGFKSKFPRIFSLFLKCNSKL